MIAAVYKSRKKEGAYLYVTRRDDFSRVPDNLLQVFGSPEFVMLLPLQEGRSLALADIQRVRRELDELGYYLQLPPPAENLLTLHRRQLEEPSA
jgi:uncharacterized protein YcgL (UPF0745 family)